ncbi:hypothetical protein [Nocardia sp. NPDC047038]|uniref:hypothetical protein n=1 Tax=Nocardia sp. NPDC047038 TaxID=3154338 RepID=UPI0033C16296
MAIGDDGRLAEEWDFGDWHEPTMGVELAFHSGRRYSAIWNNTFIEFGLEVFPKPMVDRCRRAAADGIRRRHG